MQRKQIVSEILDIAERYSDDSNMLDEVVEPLFQVAKRLNQIKTAQMANAPQEPQQMTGDGSPAPTLSDLDGVIPKNIQNQAVEKSITKPAGGANVPLADLFLSAPAGAEPSVIESAMQKIPEILNQALESAGFSGFTTSYQEKLKINK